MKQKLNPKLIKLIELTHNPNLKIDENILEETSEKPTKSSVIAPKREGFIYVPSIRLYFEKQRSCLRNNWPDTHKVLQNKGLFMPTIPEFIEYLKYLKDNPNKENTQIYNEITEVREPWRANWLDADFKFKNNQLYINYKHKVQPDGSLKPQYSELLEDCLMENKLPGISLEQWLNNPTKQGLPRANIKDGKLYYWAPMKDNISVARFCAVSVWAYFSCSRYPSDADASLGVFGCCEAARAKI